MKFDKIVKSKYLYYAACVLATINLLGYVSMGSMECILLFGASAYAANHFTNNRALDIFIGLFVANVLFGCGRIKDNVKEGMEGNTAQDAVSKFSERCKGLTGEELTKCTKAVQVAIESLNAEEKNKKPQ
jgi:hypothetical protein